MIRSNLSNEPFDKLMHLRDLHREKCTALYALKNAGILYGPNTAAALAWLDELNDTFIPQIDDELRRRASA